MHKLTLISACFLLATPYMVGTAKGEGQFIILKADDFVFDGSEVIPPGWQTFIDYIENRNLKAGIGIIGHSIELGTEECFSSIRAYHNQGNIEFWNHGYSHYYNYAPDPNDRIWEFRNTSYEEQYEHLMMTQDLAKTHIGIILRSFGAPRNATDANTKLALDEVDDLKVWLWGHYGTNMLPLFYRFYIEPATGYPDYEIFLENYDPDLEYIVLQIHPRYWDTERYNEFDQIIDHMNQENVIFVTPFEYYNLLHPHLQADLNYDRIVDLEDFAILASQWLQPPGLPSADIAPEVPDGFVDTLDLAVLANSWLAESL